MGLMYQSDDILYAYIKVGVWAIKQALWDLECSRGSIHCPVYRKMGCSECKREAKSFLLDDDRLAGMTLSSLRVEATNRDFFKTSPVKDLLFPSAKTHSASPQSP